MAYICLKKLHRYVVSLACQIGFCGKHGLTAV